MAIERIETESGVRYKAVYSYSHNGKKKRLTKRFSRKGDAQNWLIQQGASSPDTNKEIDSKIDSKINLKDFCAQWLARRELRVTDGTHTEYKSKLEKKIIPNLGATKNVKDISLKDLEDLLVHLKSLNMKPKTINLYITLMKQIFKDAYEKEVITKDPSKNIDLLKVEEREITYWSKEEIDYFIGKSESWEFFDLVMVALNTGMRLGELSALRPMDINFEQNIIRVTRTVKKNLSIGSTKGKTNRSVPMTKRVRSILKKRSKLINVDDLIFKHKGNIINVSKFTDRYWNRHQFNINCDRIIRFHDLRHTFASHFMMNDGNIFTLQKILGHSDLKDTMKYAHLSPSHLQDAIGIVSF